MPQMAPIPWMLILLMINTTLMMTMAKLNYKTNIKSKKNNNMKKKKMNWKW
nr:ATP synthase F0 subunit 8 [Dictyopharidae sp. 1 WQW-2023a]